MPFAKEVEKQSLLACKEFTELLVSQITLLPTACLAQIVTKIGQAHQKGNKESARDQDDPPTAGKQCLFGKG